MKRWSMGDGSKARRSVTRSANRSRKRVQKSLMASRVGSWRTSSLTDDLDHVRRTLDAALRERHLLYVRVEQDELANVPGEAVPDPVLESLAQGIFYQLGVEGMLAQRGVGHLDFAAQDELTGVTPVKPEVVPTRGALDVFLDGRAAERQVRSAAQELGNPSGDISGEGALVYRHGLSPTHVSQLADGLVVDVDMPDGLLPPPYALQQRLGVYGLAVARRRQ